MNIKYEIGKVNQMRSSLHPKIRIFDLERLRDVESKNILSKSWRNNQNLKLLKANFFYLIILSKKNRNPSNTGCCCHIFTASIKLLRIIIHQMEKLCFIKFQIFIVFPTFASNFFDSTTLRLKKNRRNSRSGLLIWFTLLFRTTLSIAFINLSRLLSLCTYYTRLRTT